MNILYLSIILLFTITLSAQEPVDIQNGRTSGIAEVKLYPNPAYDGVVHIITLVNADKKITVYDVFGEVVLTDKINGKTLDISRLVAGVYVLQINEKNKTLTRKLVVK